jgi:nucleotide-binding universal stress UspA family protein
MSKPILVGYEPNTLDHAPVRFGVAAVRMTGARLIIATVSHGADALQRLGSGNIDEELAADGRAALDDIKATLEAEGIEVECLDLKGLSAPRALHEAAEREDAGLLVVGSMRSGERGRVVPGATVDRLMHGAPCPIAVVPQGWERQGLETIGVGYVETDEAHEALRTAVALARRAGARVVVVTVAKVEIPYAQSRPGVVIPPPSTLAELEEEHRAWAEAAVQTAVRALDGDVPVETHVVVAHDPADVLCRMSDRFDLLVCGSRGYGPLRAVLLGSVSRRVVGEARCPVLVVPRGTESTLEALLAETTGATSA